MKILHLISSLGLFGAENVMLSLGQLFHKKGEKVVVGAITTNKDDQPKVIDKAQQLGLSTYILDARGQFDLASIFRLKNYLKEEKIDLLHTHNYKSDVFGLIAARLAKVPIVATAHGYTNLRGKVAFYENLDRYCLKKHFDKFAVVAENVLPGNIAKKKIIANGIDINRFSDESKKRYSFRKQFGIKDDDFVIGTIGRLSQEKNQGMLIKAAAKIVAKHENARFVIVGEGEQHDSLLRMIDAAKLNDKVILTGLISNIEEVYAALDVFVLTSLTEGIPMTILEAMSARVPVIATKVGGIPEIIKESETGLFVISGNSENLVERLDQIIENKELRSKLSDNAYEFVKHNYSYQQMGQAYTQLYESVLKKEKK